MVIVTKVVAALLLCTPALAAPAPEPTAAPNPDDALAKRATTCTFSGSKGHSSASVSKTSCSTIVLSALAVPSGVTLNLEKLNDGTTVIFRGRTTFGYAEWEGSLVSISGNRITIKGDPGSVLDGQGALYWDGQGGSGGKTKPKFFKANNLVDSVLDGITILNAPKNSFSLNRVTNLVVKNILIDDKAGATLGKNTDGFNINNADGVFITNVQVYNQDDCMNVNTGQNILMTNSFCSGSHGLSIGSVADGAVVRNVTYDNITVEKSQQAVRIKTVSGATASVSDITYRNIKINGGTATNIVDYGIIVDQSYGGTKNSPTNGVKINNFVLDNVTGTVPSDAINIQIQCGVGSCTNFKWTNVKVTGGKKSTNCMNVPAGVSC
ncbi:Polygalacturonase-3 [Drechslerella dactyloides]|uniref:endo-polygalacturonase n=1 Tax=Drechslerella dactyloides TaxID=74499 RepID=A0AAD6IU10_DREDA|nr:Polygalacturonase-3 [Drechslerella dactyloides]